jgi:hypothetical protein
VTAAYPGVTSAGNWDGTGLGVGDPLAAVAWRFAAKLLLLGAEPNHANQFDHVRGLVDDTYQETRPTQRDGVGGGRAGQRLRCQQRPARQRCWTSTR